MLIAWFISALLFDVSGGAQWAPWTTAAPIVMPSNLTKGYVRFTLEPQFDPTPDLRVIDESGTEAPYVTDPDEHRAASGAQREIAPYSVEFVPGAFTQAVVDFGSSATQHTAISLDGGPEVFFDRVRVETSNDRNEWTLVRKDAYIYRGSGDKNANLIVSFPPTKARFVRLQILDSEAKFPIAGWSVSGFPPERGDTLIGRPQPFAPKTPAGSTKQIWVADFGRPVAGVAIEFLNPVTAFSRVATVEGSPNGTDWHDIGSGPIANALRGAPHAAFSFGEQRARFWRVSVENGSHGTLGDLMPRLLTLPHDLLFEPALNRSYVLLANNDLATPPAYDLEAKIEREDWEADLATLGDAAPNPAFENARPIFERYPWLLTVGGIVGAAGLALLILRILRPRPRPKDVFTAPEPLEPVEAMKPK